MVPKDASTREPVNFIKKNKKLLNDKKRKASIKGEKNPDSRRQSATPTEVRNKISFIRVISMRALLADKVPA